MTYRHLAGALALAVGITVAGCGAPTERSGDEVNQPADCGQCASERMELRQVVEKIDGVQRIISMEYVTRRGITRLPGISLELVVESGRVTQVAGAIAEAAWKSNVSPLKAIDMVSVDGPDADPEVTQILYENNRLKQYEADWGPRPTG